MHSPFKNDRPYITDKQLDTRSEKFGYLRIKSFLLETDLFYPSNRFLSYRKHLATIRQIFRIDVEMENAEGFLMCKS